MEFEDKIDFLLCEKLEGTDFEVFEGKDHKKPALAKVYSYSHDTLAELKQAFPNSESFYARAFGLMIKLF